jgi:hypothetical protein
MHLRDHPLMIRQSGYLSWPPAWTTTHHDKDDKPIGEIGILEDVVMTDLIDNKLFMFILFEGYRYMGFLGFDDPMSCHQIYGLLKSHVSLSIKQIGDLDVISTP